jgi:hypothetical protein
LKPSAEHAARWLPCAAHLLPALWLFAGPLFAGRVLFFRDLSLYYYPNYVFVAGSLAQGVWPLWNPTSDAGAPFLMAYPVEIAVLATAGARAAMAVLPPFHVWIAMCGATVLCRRWGAGPWGAWAAGLFYGASGFVLSAVNLMELFHASAWAPWVVAAILRVAETPSRRAVAALAVLAALQTSTLGAEVVLQTALAAAVMMRAWPRGRALAGLAGGGVLAALLAAPALMGTWQLVSGTARARGFSPEGALGWSVRGPVLLEALLPRLFGNVHAFSDAGYWGQTFFPTTQPYLLSLYLGLGVLVLALAAGGEKGRWRLWLLVGLGIALALGRHGPLAAPLMVLMKTFRSPVKFALLADLALCVLAGLGVDRVRRAARGPLWALAPGLALLAAGAAIALWPDLPARLFAPLLPPLAGPQARVVAAQVWPSAFLVSGALATGVGLVLAGAPRWAPAAALLAGLDLLAVNSTINTTADRTFYVLRPEVRALVDRASGAGLFRWFATGIEVSPALHFNLSPATQDHDVWLYYLDRQSLRPRTHVLDGFEGAFDEDRVGWAPAGSTLVAGDTSPARFPDIHDRLRLANVRWVLSFHPLPDELVSARGEARLPEIREPLRLYEIRAALPRAFWTAEAGALPVAAGTPPAVVYERLDAHTVRLRASTPPGSLVVLDGYHRDWRAEGRDGPLAVMPTHGRYWAIATAGGDQIVTVRYRPRWRAPALAAAALGAVGALGLAVTSSRRGSPRGAAPDVIEAAPSVPKA